MNTATLEQLTTPQVKNERWRYSGFKGLTQQEQAGTLKHHTVTAAANKTQTEVVRLAAAPLVVEGYQLTAQRGAVLNFVLINDLPLDAKNFNLLDIVAEEGAQVSVTLLNFGSDYTRQEVTAYLRGRNANVQLRSLTMADGKREVDQRTLQIHEAPEAKSDLLFKNVLEGGARTIFSGLIKVAPGAQKTDAYQKNRNLILSEDAHAHSLPGLEIEANDVRCTHGATNGNLSSEELFYLKARGVPEREAQKMLVGGYCEEIIATLPPEVAQWARTKLGYGD